MINTDKPRTWTVYDYEARDGKWAITATTWTAEGPIPTSTSVVDTITGGEADAKARQSQMQAGYDTMRRQAIRA